MPVLNDLLAHITIEEGATFSNLTLFPLLNGNAGEPDYLTLDEALTQKCVRITEVSESGSVPKLRLINESDRRVLLLDGEELVGAKQNRVLNLTILAPARQTLVIPVSCVEAGRWSRRSAEFASESRMQYSSGRARKMAHVSESLHTRGERHSRQREVWGDIDAKMQRMASRSATQAMGAMYDQESARIEDYVTAFAPHERQVGALFAINGEMVGFDLFDWPSTLRKLLPKLVRSYALDAIDALQAETAILDRTSAEEFLHAITEAEAQTFPAVGEGEDLRLTAARLVGGGLIADGRLVHLSAFRLTNGNTDRLRSSVSLMTHPSARTRSKVTA